jgi:hypothetical protein
MAISMDIMNSAGKRIPITTEGCAEVMLLREENTKLEGLLEVSQGAWLLSQTENAEKDERLDEFVLEADTMRVENARLKSLAEPLTIALYNEMSERHTVVCKENAKLQKALKKYGEH